MGPFIAAASAASSFVAVFGYFWWRDTLRLGKARQLLDAGAILLDVGTPEQFEADHISGAVNIPADAVARRQGELGERSRAVVVYARSSLSSSVAAQVLRGVGFHTVTSVGTLRRWRAEAPDGPGRRNG
jgi:rhodanese-related sulfurtransferase